MCNSLSAAMSNDSLSQLHLLHGVFRRLARFLDDIKSYMVRISLKKRVAANLCGCTTTEVFINKDYIRQPILFIYFFSKI